MGILNLVRRRRPAPAPVPALSPEAEFWAWFAAHEAMVWGFLDDVENVFAHITVRMWRVHPDLAFDFGAVTDGRREFVVSAGGSLDAFPAVLGLTAAAPPLKRWKITAFRPRRPVVGEILVAGVTLQLPEVRFVAERMGDKLDVFLFIPGYRRTPLDEFDHVGAFLLDLAVGEFDAQMHLADVFIGPLQPDMESRPLAELPALVDALPRN